VSIGTECPCSRDDHSDQSAFITFHYAQRPALGFCPNVNAVYEATVTRQEDGSFLLEMSVIEEGDPDSSECLDPGEIIEVECAVVRELPARTLTPEEAQRVLTAFRDIRTETVHFDGICIDPCLVPIFQWDELILTNTPAGCITGPVEVLASGTYQVMTALLEDLRVEQ
jgi:hypothetical protein